jgi:hypothetical protein
MTGYTLWKSTPPQFQRHEKVQVQADPLLLLDLVLVLFFLVKAARNAHAPLRNSSNGSCYMNFVSNYSIKQRQHLFTILLHCFRT